jgi:hypothetical protein
MSEHHGVNVTPGPSAVCVVCLSCHRRFCRELPPRDALTPRAAALLAVVNELWAHERQLHLPQSVSS